MAAEVAAEAHRPHPLDGVPLSQWKIPAGKYRFQLAPPHGKVVGTLDGHKNRHGVLVKLSFAVDETEYPGITSILLTPGANGEPLVSVERNGEFEDAEMLDLPRSVDPFYRQAPRTGRRMIDQGHPYLSFLEKNPELARLPDGLRSEEISRYLLPIKSGPIRPFGGKSRRRSRRQKRRRTRRFR